MVLTGGVITGWWVWSRPGSGETAVKRVVLISIDTCRADYLSCYGFDRKTTPNIDAVAAEGILFEQVVSPVPLTLPAHSSMLTGTIPPYHGVHDNHGYQLAGANVTLAEVLGGQGYRTRAVIGAFVLDGRFGMDQGFDIYDDPEAAETLKDITKNERRGGEVSRLACDFLAEQGEDPFFLFLHYYDPHVDYRPPEPFAGRFRDDLYAGEIAYVDDCIGKVVAKLKSRGWYDSTLLIITSDHGEMLEEHNEHSHGYFIYESAIKVPLIIKEPGQKRSRKIAETVGLIDVMPTVLSYAGIKTPAVVQGEDLSCYGGREQETAGQRSIYCESLFSTRYFCNPLLGVVSGSWKYIETTRPELYDVGIDRGETNNLVEQEPQRAKEMRSRLKILLANSARAAQQSGRRKQSVADQVRLESLGYVGGGIRKSFEIDPGLEDPKDAISFYRDHMRAKTLITLRKYAEAQELCEMMRAQKPDFAGTYYYLAKVAVGQGNVTRAIEHYRRSLELDPENPGAHISLAGIYNQQGRLDEAIEHWKAVVAFDPHNLSVRRRLGRVLGQQGRFAEAAEQFGEVVRQKPEDADGHKGLAVALVSLNRLDEATRHLERAVQLKPGGL